MDMTIALIAQEEEDRDSGGDNVRCQQASDCHFIVQISDEDSDEDFRRPV
jgi:hypothetical protein